MNNLFFSSSWHLIKLISQMASESNTTLHNAMRLHIDNLRLLAKPLDQLQKEIPSMADLDEASEANIAEVTEDDFN